MSRSRIRVIKRTKGMGYKGFFRPSNLQKYKGDPTNIIYRSSWELIVMKKFDSSPDVLQWSSEEIVIPYFDPSSNRYRRYFPDFYVKYRTRDGEEKVMLIEIKPEHQKQLPKKGKKRTRRYVTEALTYARNVGKWAAAEAFCKTKGWEFKVWTERDLGLS